MVVLWYHVENREIEKEYNCHNYKTVQPSPKLSSPWVGLPKSGYGQVGWATNLISLQLLNSFLENIMNNG